ncbi:hypothetical protein HPB50_005947 [Hyalomma asiaticum]|uniref:Uncharacterized protein n=1 Tax=Hyalomma asiaticum TaxID=266040 RepID=A0ACB7RMS2_HYAAI|nr:hypothetical protein HPB50_005947 [Hyalomma asiaticum]
MEACPARLEQEVRAVVHLMTVKSQSIINPEEASLARTNQHLRSMLTVSTCTNVDPLSVNSLNCLSVAAFRDWWEQHLDFFLQSESSDIADEHLNPRRTSEHLLTGPSPGVYVVDRKADERTVDAKLRNARLTETPGKQGGRRRSSADHSRGADAEPPQKFNTREGIRRDVVRRKWYRGNDRTIVYPRLLESRADDGGLVLNIREGLTLNLRKSSILAKDFVLTSSAANGTEELILDGSVLERDLYHDTEHLSSLLVNRRGNGVEVRGILKGRLRIAPVVATQRSDGDVIPHNVFVVQPSADLAEQTVKELVDNGIQGVAYIGKVCTDLSVAVVEDRPQKYTGTSVLAHEIAHALGATHDGLSITPPDVVGYPTARNCSPDDEYLMGPSASGRKVHSLSNCTKAQIRFWFRCILPYPSNPGFRWHQSALLRLEGSSVCPWDHGCKETLVYPRLLESRADDGALVLHIREGLTLNLRKSSILAKDFVVASFTTAGSASVLLDGSELERDLYHDSEHLSSLLVSRRQNGVEVRGTLTSQLRITPVLTAQRSDEDLIPHSIFNVEERSAPSNASHARPKTRCAQDDETTLGKYIRMS